MELASIQLICENVLGFRTVKIDTNMGGEIRMFRTPDELPSASRLLAYCNPSVSSLEPIWNPSKNLDDAFEVITALRALDFSIVIVDENEAYEKVWIAEIGLYANNLDDVVTGNGESQSLPEAICLAVLEIIQSGWSVKNEPVRD